MYPRWLVAASWSLDLFGAFPFLRLFIIVQVLRGPSLPAPGLLQRNPQRWSFKLLYLNHKDIVYLVSMASKSSIQHLNLADGIQRQYLCGLLWQMEESKVTEKGMSENLPQQLLWSNSGSFNGVLGRQPLHYPTRIASHGRVNFYKLHIIFYISKSCSNSKTYL
jgi:hypothetical protein